MILPLPRAPHSARSAAFFAALLLSACGSQADGPGTDEAAAKGGEATVAPANTGDAAAKDAPVADGAAGGAPQLSAYVGKYPFDQVDGVRFADHPLVKAGLARTVTDARVRTAITTTQGPSAPIEMIGGKVASWACQQHNCGEHQWTILVDPATGATDVCYMNDPAMVSESRWFLASGKQETRNTDCSGNKSQG